MGGGGFGGLTGVAAVDGGFPHLSHLSAQVGAAGHPAPVVRHQVVRHTRLHTPTQVLA